LLVFFFFQSIDDPGDQQAKPLVGQFQIGRASTDWISTITRSSTIGPARNPISIRIDP